MDTPTIMAATPRRIDPYSLDLHRPTPMASVTEDGHEPDPAAAPDEYALDQEVNIPQSASDNSFFQFEVRGRSVAARADAAVRIGCAAVRQL